MADQDGWGERIAEALFGGDELQFAARLEREEREGGARGFSRAYEIANGIFISDVMDHARRFYLHAEALDAIGERMPCISMGDFEYAPIDFLPFSPFGSGPMFYRRYYPEVHDYYREWLRDWDGSGNVAGEKSEMRFFPPREALKFILRGAARFLNSRFLSSTTPTAYSPVPFTLHNQNPNHQIYYSSPYYFVTSNVFGGPSTPVTQHIHPGIYVFGVMGPNVHINHHPQFETTSQFDIPRLHTSGTLVYI